MKLAIVILSFVTIAAIMAAGYFGASKQDAVDKLAGELKEAKEHRDEYHRLMVKCSSLLSGVQ
jgi:hypothetical protein